MKPQQFQDKVLEHLGSDAEWKKNIHYELKQLKQEVKSTNGTVRRHQSFIDNFSGKIAVIGTLVIFGANIAWQFIADKLK